MTKQEEYRLEDLGLSPAGTELMRTMRDALVKFIQTPGASPHESVVAVGGSLNIILNHIPQKDAAILFGVFVEASRDTLREHGVELPDGVVNEAMRSSLKKMLEVYWGDGDGREPPQFILDAQRAVAA